MNTIEEVYKNIYLCKIPLKGNPLKYINIYVIKSEDKYLIVDTGFNTEEILNMTKDFLQKLDIKLDKTILFLTHLHSDHTGLLKFYEQNNATIYMSKIDAELMKDYKNMDGNSWNRMRKHSIEQGLKEDAIDVKRHPGYKYSTKEDFEYEDKNPGDIVEIGDFRFEVISLKGHTPGMIGLHEKEKSILFCGDHILSEITPNIQFWGFEFGDSLGQYLENLNLVKNMNIKHLFSSHRSLILDVNGRIDEIIAHHKERIKEVLIALEGGEKTATEVAAEMKWDIAVNSFDEFPLVQKWFAVGEAHAHLEHLRAIKKVDFRKNEEGIFYYYKL